MQRGGAADHVGEGVERADFVQVDVLGVLTVERRLGRAQKAEDILSERSHSRHKGRRGNQTQHIAEGSRDGRVVDVNVDLGCRQPMASIRPRADLDPLHAQSPDGCRHRLDRCTRVEQRAQQHVARRARRGVDPQATAGFCHKHLLLRAATGQLDGDRASCTQGGPAGWPGQPRT